MEKKTIYVLLAKPLARWQFLLGKYCGLSMTIFIEVLVMTICLFGLLCFYYGLDVPWVLFKAIIPICFELLLILAVALMFSTFSTPFLSGMFTLSIFIIGHLTEDLRLVAKASENESLKSFAEFIYYSFPNLENLNFKSQVVHGLPVSGQELIFSIIYALCYTVSILLAAILIFRKRDLK